MTPLERYQADLLKPGFERDAAQLQAVEHLHALYLALVAAEQDTHGPSALARWVDRWRRPKTVEPIRGLYFWGGVGRGKTYLMDTFFDTLPFPRKLRAHFHRFMQRVHRELKELSGEKNPLQLIAQRLATETRIICFDEFFVSDIIFDGLPESTNCRICFVGRFDQIISVCRRIFRIYSLD